MRPPKTLLALCLTAITIACDGRSPLGPSTALNPELSRSVAGGGLTAAVISASEIDLSWNSAGSVSGYEIFRSSRGSSGNYTLLVSTTATVIRYADQGLLGGTQYCYRVRSFKTAHRSTAYSTFSTVSCATTLAPPPPSINAPSETDVIPEGNEIVKLTWADKSANEDGFHIEVAAVAVGPWTPTATLSANATVWYQFAPAERQVCYRVVAFNAAGASPPSTPDCTTPPASPTNLTAKAAVGRIELTWADNSAVEDGYRVARMGPGDLPIDIATLPANTVRYQDTGATTDVTYTYRVIALKDGGLSDYSEQAVVVIATRPPVAPLLTDVVYTPDTEGYGWNYVDIVWDGTATLNEEGFRVEYSADGVTGWVTYGLTGANETGLRQKYSVFDAPPSDGCYRVFAFNAAGDSAPSRVGCYASATTAAAPAAMRASIARPERPLVPPRLQRPIRVLPPLGARKR